MTGRRIFAVLFVSAAVVAGWLCLRNDPAALSPVTVVSLRGPDVVTAGSAVVIEIETVPFVGTANLLVRSGMTLHHIDVAIAEGRGKMTLPAAISDTAGILTVFSAAGATHQVDIRPGRVVAPIEPLVGPHSIVADGVDRTLAVTLPRDQFGNPTEDGTVVSFHREPLAGVPENAQHGSIAGIAWRFFRAGTVSGTSRVWAEVEGQNGPVVVFDEVPGRAVVVPVVLPDSLPAADGRTVLTLLTTEVFDGFGNVLLDGTEGHFSVVTASGAMHVPGVVISGRLRAEWTVPSVPGPVSIRAEVHGRLSEPVAHWFDSAVAHMPVSIESHPDGIAITVGPVLDANGSFVADGTPVQIGDQQVSLRNAAATRILAHPYPETISVKILGHIADFDVDQEVSRER